MPASPSTLTAAVQNQDFTQHQAELQAKLREWFRVDFALFDAASGETLLPDRGGLGYDGWFCGQLCRTGRLRHGAELIVEEGPLAVLAIPTTIDGRHVVGVGTFSTDRAADDEQVGRIASKLERSPQDV